MGTEPIKPETTALKIGALFADETSRAIHGAQSGNFTPVAFERDGQQYLGDYLQICQKMLAGRELLPEAALENLLKDIRENAKLKLLLPAGIRVCIAVVPFGIYGHALSTEELEDRAHVRVFLVDRDGTTLSGLINEKSDHFKLLPKAVQQNCLSVPVSYDNEKLYEVTDADRARLENEITRVFREAQKIFSDSATPPS